MYYLVKLLDIPSTTVTPQFVKNVIRYFMYKYKIVYNDCFNDHSNYYYMFISEAQSI